MKIFKLVINSLLAILLLRSQSYPSLLAKDKIKTLELYEGFRIKGFRTGRFVTNIACQWNTQEGRTE